MNLDEDDDYAGLRRNHAQYVRFDLGIGHTAPAISCFHVVLLLETPLINMNIWVRLCRFHLSVKVNQRQPVWRHHLPV